MGIGFVNSIARLIGRIKIPEISFVSAFVILLFLLSGCQTSTTIKNTNKTRKDNITIVQESGKPLTYQDMVKRFDLNKDGVLDENEIEQTQKLLGTRQPTFTTQTSEQELPIRRALILPGKSEAQSEDPIISKYDLNRDGILDENEVNLLKNDLKYGNPTTTKPIKPKKQSTVVTTPAIKTKRNPIVR